MAKRGPEYLGSTAKIALERAAVIAGGGALSLFAAPASVGTMIEQRTWNPIYSQVRSGRTIKKILTIADPHGTNARNVYGTVDPRATTYGNMLRATGIDEYPQLAAVLRGHMMLYGVRDLLEQEKEKLAEADGVLFNDFTQAVQESGVKPSLFSPSSAWRKSIRYDATDKSTVRSINQESMKLDLEYLTEKATLVTDIRALGKLPIQIMTGIKARSWWNEALPSVQQPEPSDVTPALAFEATVS